MKLTVLPPLFALVVSGLAQTTSTSILGTVTDSSGAIVTDAKVTALETDTGIRRDATTSSTGDYNFPLLNVGTYEITVVKPGFKTESRRVTIELNQKARVDFALEVGAIAEQIQITGEAPVLSTEDASLGLVVNTRT
ncbi:MAG TPA: carboxypeptidase-like regulatory domain-containing protein, partial [Terriglobales bacterium]